MSETFEPIEDGDFVAADYVLGTLTIAERLAVERRMRRDPVLRAEIEAWQARLSPMVGGVEPVAPPERLWSGIEAALPPLPHRSDSRRPDRGTGLVPAFWRWLAIGTSGLAAASLAGLAFLAVPAGDAVDQGIAMTAAITSDADGLPLFAVVLDPVTDSATLVPIRLETAAGQVPELWLVREGGTPQSLGVIDPSEPLRIAIDPEMMEGDMAGGQLAISLEPEGGSPTGQPTGPIVGSGALRSI